MADMVVLIPAGGIGTRLGLRTPKQFLGLAGAPILAATVAHFARHVRVERIVVAAPAAHVLGSWS
jgi:2-C-methyl-D-erythritol 4-phosphate cytidylyltransferase